jgi:anion-transporting  ArsA/GET3 family ATPase
VFVTGKGGVGKTAVATALGLVASRRGIRTMIAEVARRDDVHRSLTGEPAGGGWAETRLDEHLYALSVDPERAMEEYLADQLPGPLADLLASSRMFGYLAAASPGMRELLTVGKLWELAQHERRTPGAQPYDLVVVDAPATGHGLALLDAPRTFAGVAAAGPVSRQAAIIDGTLRDPLLTGIVAVATPEEMPVNEALHLHEELGSRVDLVVANGVRPDRFSDAEAERIAATGDGAAATVALAAHGRAREQRDQLARLRAGVATAVLELPFCPDGGTAAADVGALAERLDVAL